VHLWQDEHRGACGDESRKAAAARVSRDRGDRKAATESAGAGQRRTPHHRARGAGAADTQDKLVGRLGADSL